MSALLRSAKFLRLFGGIARSFTAPSARTEPDSFLSAHRQLWQGIDTRSLASQATAQVVQPDTFQSLEKALQKIDSDARNTGRVQSQDVEEIHAEVKASGAISGSQGLMLLRCCGNLAAEEMPEHRTQLALGIWQTLTSIGVPLDISHYNALLRVYLDNEHTFSPAEFLSYLKTQGVEPNRVTYQRLIYRYCMLGDIDGATDILGHMKENGLAINEDVFNSLIIGHARAKDLESAESMIGMMRRTSLEPSSETYRHLACGHADCGDIDGVQRALQLARDDEVLLRGRDLLEVVYSLTVAGYKDKLQEIMDRLKNTRLYNQDIVSVVLRLVNAGHDDVAFDMLRLMSHGTGPRPVDVANTGSFFIRQLVHLNREPSVVLDYCQKMRDLQLNDKAVLVALQRSLQRPQPGVAEAFLSALPAYGFQLRSHYFWPLMVRARHNKSYPELLSVMQLMRSLNCFIGVDTMVEQVFPTLPLAGVSYNKALYDLSNVGIGYQQTAQALCRYQLLKEDVEAAAEVTNRYGVSFSHLPLLRPLAHQFGSPAADHQLQMNSTLQVLHRMCESVDSSGCTAREIASSFLLEVLHAAGRSRSSAVQAMAEAMLSRGLAVTAECATAIQTQLSANGCTDLDQLCRLLEQLSSEQLQPIGPAADFASSSSTGVDQQLRQSTGQQLQAGYSRRTMALDNDLTKARQEGGDLVIPLSLLFSKLTQIRNYKRAASIKKELERVLDGPLPEKLLRSWCQLCISYDLLPEATSSFQQLSATYPENLEDQLVLKLARLMISEKQIDEAVLMLEEMPRDQRDELQREDYEYFMTVWRLLNVPSEAGDTATVRRLLQVLQQHGYVPKNRTRPLLALLIKSFICNNDLSGAMEELELIYKEYRMIPGRSHLMAALIKAENPDIGLGGVVVGPERRRSCVFLSARLQRPDLDGTHVTWAWLQRVIEMSTELSGEMETLYELAFSFVDCGKSRQAQKVLQTPGLRAQHRRLYYVCDGYLADGQVDRLEGILTATREAFGVDRLRIYQYVLQAHCASRASTPEQALAVWTRMQEEGLAATDAMLAMLAQKLHRHKHPVPFQVPVDVSQPPPPFNVNSARTTSRQQMTSQQVAASRPAQSAAVPQTTLKSQLKKALQANKLEEALQLRDRMIASSVDISVHDLSQMVEQLVRSDRLKEACDVTMHMLERDTFPAPRVLKFLLARLAAGGDVDTVTAFGTKLKDDLKSTLSYDNRLCTAFLSSGRGEEYLERLETTCQQMTSTDSVGTDGLVFPSGGFLGILRSMPQLHDRCVRLVHEFAERGVLAPANMLWAHHFVNGSYDEAQKVFDQHLQQKDVILFRVIVDKAVSTKDQQMAQRLYSTVQHSSISHIAKSVVFSALFNLSAANDPPAVSLELFKNSGFKAEELKSSAREQLELLQRTQNDSSGLADTTTAST